MTPTEWPATFTWQGRQLYYNTNPHNNLAERVVEIPIAFDWLCQNPSGERTLEVGNVLQYYENGSSDVHLNLRNRSIVDKFEQARGVTNCDVLELPQDEPFDRIISISTIEHVGQGIEWQGGYGESKARDRFAPLKAIAYLYDLLAPGGQALISVPWGKLTDFGWLIQFSPAYLELLHTHLGLPRSAVTCATIRKIAMAPEGDRSQQRWEQCDPSDSNNIEFNSPWQYANAVGCITLLKGDRRGTETPVTETSVQLEFAPPIVIGGVLQHDFQINAEIISQRMLKVVQPGAIFYGPYKRVPAGQYILEYSFESNLPLTLDLCINSGNTIVLAQDLDRGRLEGAEFILEKESEIEIRLHNRGDRGFVKVNSLILRWLSLLA